MRFLSLALLILAACGGSSPRSTTSSTSAPPIDRVRFNQLANRLDLGLFWASDDDQDGEPDPGEVRSLLFYPGGVAWVEDGEFTPAYRTALEQIHTAAAAPRSTDPRLSLVVQELDLALPTLVETDVSALPPVHRAFAEHMLSVAAKMDALYARQTGVTAMAARLEDADPASRSLFRRNWGPSCKGRTTESEAACSAIEGAPRQPVDVYPAAMQANDEFCASIEGENAGELDDPFTVVRERDGHLVAVPYSTEYSAEMRGIATDLRAAADAMTDPAETALVTYLRAAATSFETNDWTPADEAWSRMNANNSKWYVRVGPDETYWEPCSLKAGFHLTFALINTDSLAWQTRLTPVQREMENAMAALVPDVYHARDVSFHMPDFIDIVVNAGDDRDAFGATIGQSLPNWGPVAEQSRGRTVAMSNLYTDPDSQRLRREHALSLLDDAGMQHYTDSAEPGLVATILHEATHNLGPAHEYRVEGRTADEAFGGDLASMLEELKAQSGGLFLIDFLRTRNLLTEEQARATYVDSVTWAFGHISRGMYTPSGARKAYSQLAAIQIGFLLDEGALRWDDSAIAADGSSHGAFSIDFDRLPTATQRLMERVLRIKATADRAAAEALAAQYVDGPLVPQAAIASRYRDSPQTTFVYAVRR